MKNIKYLAIGSLACLMVGLSSCSKQFLERSPNDAVSNELALSSPSNIQAGTVGIMSYFAISAYAGRDLQVIGDLITDNVTTISGNSGHLLDVEKWNLSSSLSEVSNLWIASYQIVATSTKVIAACNRLISDGATSKADIKSLKKYKATALTAKVFAESMLTQYFCLPYKNSNEGNVNGIILIGETPVNMEEAKDPSSPLFTATLKATYTHMHAELTEAIKLWGEAGERFFISTNSAYFPNLCMTYLLQARLFLDQGKNTEASAAAELALKSLPAGANATLTSDPVKIYKQYQNVTAPTTEDILTINFTSADNLSANSINNMFNSYGASISEDAMQLFQGNDIRKILYNNVSTKEREIYTKCAKYPAENGINNVPLLRVPELYLIKAEALTKEGDDVKALEELMKVLGVRDTSLHQVSDIQNKYLTNGKTVLNLVLDERRREFLGEGLRWFDMRRNNIPLTHKLYEKSVDDFRVHFTNFPIYEFALPIPESETNTGAWQNGKLKQNEAWTGTPGQSYAPVLSLPAEGSSY